MPLHEKLRYPIFLIEKKAQRYAIFDIANTKSDFVVGSRMPASKKYVDGYLFDSSGAVYEYKGSSGWPRFGEVSKPILEILIVPALLAKLAAYFFYYGPNLVTSRKVNPDEFKALILENLARHTQPKQQLELKAVLEKADSYEKVIRAIDWWRFHGGKRDEDGHPIEED